LKELTSITREKETKKPKTPEIKKIEPLNIKNYIIYIHKIQTHHLGKLASPD
jgi:hypothetical protein